MHDDRQSAGKRDPRLAHGRALCDGQRPVLELQRALIAGQHDISGLVQQGAHSSIAALGYASAVVDLAGLAATRDQAEIGADVPGTLESLHVVDGRGEGQRSQLTYAW